MPVENQVVSIFTGTNGYLDDVPLEHVQRFERELLESMALRQAPLLAEIAEKKDLTEEIQKQLHAIAKEFSASFRRS